MRVAPALFASQWSCSLARVSGGAGGAILLLALASLVQLVAAQEPPARQAGAPSPIASASYVSLDGLTLVILFDKPVNLSSLVESVERRRAAALGELGAAPEQQQHARPPPPGELAELADVDQSSSLSSSSSASPQNQQCQELRASVQQDYETQHLVQGIQLCAKLLTKKTLKFLHKYRLHNCLWPSRVQFLVQLGRPTATSADGNQPVRVSFQRGSLSEHAPLNSATASPTASNEREVSVELSKLPLESLGLPLAPKLALTGPNQVPPCGQFSLSAHLSSPFGTWPGESVRLSWSVERLGVAAGSLAAQQLQQQRQQGGVSNQTQTQPPASGSAGNNQVDAGQPQQQAQQAQQQAAELKWRALQHLVKSARGNNLVLEAQLLNFMPQLYEFHVSVTYTTSVSSLTLNATHQITKVDFEAPIGTIYGSHLLAQQALVNTNQELLLLADVRVPECASNIKQVGLYWQVSDGRVRFEQTYAPFYLAKANSMPEQAAIEFRVNLFYGIRVKKYTSSGTLVSTGDQALSAQISDGLLIVSVGLDNQQQQQLELFGAPNEREADKFSYQWSCFDGKTAQPCFKSLKMLPSNSSTGYEVGALSAAAAAAAVAPPPPATPSGASQQQQATSSGVLLIDRQRQRQPVLRLPLSWFETDAQLWFGLQRFERQNPSQHSETEYALVSVQPGSSATVSIGPVLIGQTRLRATIRNPLTGAVLLLPNTPTTVVGRLGPSALISSFAWHSPNYLQPLHWTAKNATNPLTGQTELVTELHLSPSLMVAHAHYQIQLVACSGAGLSSGTSGGGTTTATLNLDIVQGVSECRVEANQNALTSSLVVSVEYCNIPLGLSPITYQVYIADTSGFDGQLVTSGADSGGANSEPRATGDSDSYINESDELYLEAQMQPLSAPQLSPIFALTGLDAVSLLALLDRQTSGGGGESVEGEPNHSARVRFGARVCDRMQNCRLFYSNAIGLKHLLAGSPGGASSNQSASASLVASKVRDTARNWANLLHSLQTMIDGSRRLNTAGNSIAAVSVLSGVISLSQRMLQASKQASGGSGSGAQRNQKLRLQQQQLQQGDHDANGDARLRELMQVAMRECLQFGASSVQRQFHYTDSGQTNLVTSALGRIMGQPEASVELRFRAARLLAQVTRRSLNEQLQLGLTCLADLRTMQGAYESLAETFSQHWLGAGERHSGAGANSSSSSSSSGGANSNSHTRLPSFISSLSSAFGPSNSSGAQAQAPPASGHHAHQRGHHAHHQHSSRANQTSRKKREEAILAYLRVIRQAYRALLSAAAMQLPLGANHQFQYVDAGVEANVGVEATSNKPPVADIASSLTHLTELPSSTIDIDLHDFGTVSIKFQERLVDKLRLYLNELNCRNGSKLLQLRQQQLQLSQFQLHNQQLEAGNNCSSFVLAVSSFAGKAPFRSLDEAPSGLRVPILEVSLISPLDGSNLLDLMREQQAQAQAQSSQASSSAANQMRHLEMQDFQTTVTFSVPAADAAKAPQEPLAAAADSSIRAVDQAAAAADKDKLAAAAKRREFKCYQFDETLNEWVKPAEVESTQGEQQTASDKQQLAADEQQQQQQQALLVIRCTFNTLGVYGAFQGVPPPTEGSMRLSILLSVTAVLALVVLIALLGCAASREQHRRNKGRQGQEGDEDDEEDDGDANHRHHHRSSAARHPEQTYRNDFNYPLG